MNAKLREAAVIRGYTSQHDARGIAEREVSKHCESFNRHLTDSEELKKR